jgi:hypothetical protein
MRVPLARRGAREEDHMRSRAAKQVHGRRRMTVLVAGLAVVTCTAPMSAAADTPAQVPPPFTASPTSVVFPPTQVGQQSPPQQLVVTNTGSSPQQFQIYGWPQLPLQVTG